MNNSAADFRKFQSLELKLLHTNWQQQAEELEKLLSEQFMEIGPSGRVTSRAAVINWLLHKDADERWSIDELNLHRLSPDITLVYYRARRVRPSSASRGSMRTSIWQNAGAAGQWQLLFHQATKILES